MAAGACNVGVRLLQVRLRGTNVPVSATLAPRSTLFLRLPDSETRHSASLGTPELRRLNGSIGEYSPSDTLNGAVGEPNEEDREGGGTDGYVRVRG